MLKAAKSGGSPRPPRLPLVPVTATMTAGWPWKAAAIWPADVVLRSSINKRLRTAASFGDRDGAAGNRVGMKLRPSA